LLAVSDRRRLDAWFDLVACAEDYGSGGIAELLLDVTERLDTHPSECVYLGSRILSVDAAMEGGIAAVGCSWGVRDPAVYSGVEMLAERPAEVLRAVRLIDDRRPADTA
jgi:FMN phosphatase YigB (HAD superfamily)